MWGVKKVFQGYNLYDYDFLDMGSGTGESIDFCIQNFKARKGLGIDIKESKVETARENGIPTILGNILEMDIPHKFKFISMMDFLEHLPSIEDSKSIIRRASEMATDFLYIRHPSFEDIEYLRELGLKITWYDWKGHTSLMRVTDYCEVFNELGLSYTFKFRKPITDSNSEFVISLDTPVDTVRFDPKKHKKEKNVKFGKTIYGQIDIFVALKEFKLEKWAKITNFNK